MSTPFSRRGFLYTGAAAIGAPSLWFPARANKPGDLTTTRAPFVEVEIDSGRIRGAHSRGALAFKGIPYAGSVAGRNRFKAPPPVKPWTGVRDATQLGPPALQTPNTTYGENEPPYSEDCLVLNVWTPAVKDGGKRSVMYYLHGGGFETGSGGQNIQDGSRLAATYDVVVVASNHRLGLLGYLYLDELGGADHGYVANPGMLDISASLQWIKRNIAIFGGDPDNVLVFGESGGGMKTSVLMAMPSAQGLFHKVGVQSGPMLHGSSKEVATETARRVLAGLGLDVGSVGRLSEAPAEKLLAIQLAGRNGPLGKPSKEWLAAHPNPPSGMQGFNQQPGGWGPVTDATVLPRDPFSPDATPLSADVPMLIGNMEQEATFFERDNPAYFHMDEAALSTLVHRRFGDSGDRLLSVYRKTRPQATPGELGIAIETALIFGADTATQADRKARQRAPVYRYRNDFKSNIPIAGTDWKLGAGHASDISLVFLNYDMPDLQGNGPGLAETANAISSYFATFARNGVPSAADQPTWPRYDTTTRPVMLLNTRCNVVNDPDGEERQFWQSLTSRA
jgi:para-nitrobenzyl esterase